MKNKAWQNIVKQVLPYLILIGLGVFVLSQHFPDFFEKPNDWLLVEGGDGLHNYFTFAYYLKFDEGTRFTGMTYPYGEHQLFTDGHFLYAWLLKGFGVQGHDSAAWFIHIFMLLGFVLGLVYLYKILRYYRLAVWYSILVAIIIALLSPQVQRVIAHYSLSQIGFIPMFWYSLLRISEPKPATWRYGVPVFLILFYGLIHPYYFPMGIFFLGSFWFISTLAHLKRFSEFRSTFFRILGILLLTFVVFYGFTIVTDPVSDRHSAPYGLFYYHATFESIFLPSFGPMLDLWKSMTVVKTSHPVESLAYVGFAGFFCLIFLAIRVIRRLIQGDRWRALRFTTHKPLQYTLIGAALVALLSTAWPFVDFPVVLEWFPFFKQFRSLGRFAWMFYYVFTVYSAIYFFQVFKTLSRKGNRIIGYSFLGILILVWGMEAIINVKRAGTYIDDTKVGNKLFRSENQDYTNMIQSAGYDVDDFQAVLALPYFNNGSEKLYIERSGASKSEAYKCAFDTGLPLLNLHSPRTSISQAFQLAQLLSSELIRKTILDTLQHDGRPILLIDTKNSSELAEIRLIEKAKPIVDNSFIRISVLELEAFEDQQVETINQFSQNQDSMVQFGSLLLSDSSEHIRYKSFDVRSSEIRFLGDGAFHSEGRNDLMIDIFSFDLEQTETFKLSTWVYADPDISSFPSIRLTVVDSTDTWLRSSIYNSKLYTEVVQDWARVSITMDLQKGERLRVDLLHENIKLWKPDHIIDELLIRPVDIDVYHQVEESNLLIKNNYRLPLVEN